MELNDPRWASLKGGYGVPFDPRPALFQLADGTDIQGAWGQLWDGLHHQGDVGEASYACVPHLVRIHEARGMPDWNTSWQRLIALAIAVETQRYRHG
jgi:hypothetical protein